MKVKLWGVRGSIPTPIRGNAIQEKIRKALKYASPADILDDTAIDKFIRSLPFSLTNTYGGNTTCIEVRNRKNELVILDAGTGIRSLGEILMREGYATGKGECSMIFTHTHWDHIQGIPFFLPIFVPGNTFHIHSCMDDLEERLQIQHGYKNFPVSFEGLEANKIFYHHDPHETWDLYGMKISHKAMRHPGVSYSIRIEEEGKVFILATDAEFKVEDMDGIEEYIDYFSGADVLIFDTQYTFEEHLQKIDWGHSSASIATDIALKAGVKKLILFHHDPSYDDKKLDEVFLRALRYREMMDLHRSASLEILIGHEGLELTL
jgi:phosphoribosyl 1,2-cyclic phosphodiesterase